MEPNLQPIYSLALSYRTTVQAHSWSNAGSNGSNRLLRRSQRLANGRETDAGSGNIAKHHHAAVCAQHLVAAGQPLCPACAVGDGRRAMALIGHPDYRDLSIDIINNCALCEIHGYLITAKRSERNATSGEETRQRRSKRSLVEYSFALARPDQFAESSQLFTRAGTSTGEGQMLMTMPTRSGVYAQCMRYQAVGVGVDTETWRVIVTDETQRRLRHQCVLKAIRDTLLSPQGALTSTMLPHVTGLEGVIAIRRDVGPAPIYSGLEADFIEQVVALADENCAVRVFRSVSEFATQMRELIEFSIPATPHPRGLSFNLIGEEHE